MPRVEFDPEILYVQKLYFFLFLVSFSLLASCIIAWHFALHTGLIFFVIGLLFSYLAMLKKKTFKPPDKKITAQRMAREISQDTSPLAIARFASQLYFYFHETERAVVILENYLSSNDPLLCATLADIFLKEGKTKQALVILRENPFALIDPLLLANQGHVLRQIGKIPEAIKMYKRSLRLAKEVGFPHNGAHWLTQKFLTISYTASIHHALGDCFSVLKDYDSGKRHYRAGNIRLLDITVWRYLDPSLNRSAKNYSKTR